MPHFIVKINKCKDSQRWYANHIDEEFILRKVCFNPCEYKVTTPDGTVNFIQPEDSTIYEVNELGHKTSVLAETAAKKLAPRLDAARAAAKKLAARLDTEARSARAAAAARAAARDVHVKVDNAGEVPARATSGAAAYDLRAVESGVVARGGKLLVRTGVAIALPKNTGGFILPRSGLSAKLDVGLANTVGLLDSDYRGEIIVALKNTGDSDYVVNAGDRVAQLAIVMLADVELRAVAMLPPTERDTNGFGSTGR